MRLLFLMLGSLMMSACSVFGDPGVEIAQYNVIQQDGNIEVREYDGLVLATTSMDAGGEGERNSPFMRLFDYISGENVAAEKIEMTAPVFMDEQGEDNGEKIAMTAPVFMDEEGDARSMSFVLPASFSYETAPRPTSDDVRLQRLDDYTVATIRFNGRLSESNIGKHVPILQSWIAENGYSATGPYITAGYNAPFTLPAARRNEVLIPVEKK